MARAEKAKNPLDAWNLAVYNVMRFGRNIFDERGQNTKEILNLIVRITDPLDTTEKHNYWQGQKLEEYVNEVLSPLEKGFVYDYGNRLRGHFLNRDGKPIDQLMDLVVPRLQKHEQSRRATAILYDMPLDMTRDEIPCLLLLDFKKRGNFLYTTGFWRSHDIFGAYYPNVVAIGKVAELVADELNAWVGPLTTHSVSAHIYATDLKAASATVQKDRVG